MPTNPLYTVGCPWTGQAGGVDGNITLDVKYSDGWRLVYCSFSPSASPYLATMPPGGLYFTLYNMYRGLLRYYLYIPPGWVNASSNIAHGLSLYPQGNTSSSLLNYEGQDVVDATQNSSAIMKTNNQQVQSLGGWQVCQYEIAYDPNIGNTNWPNLALQWNNQAINISTISIDGGITGTITGTINTPSSGGGFNAGGFFGNLGLVALQFLGGSQLDIAANAAGVSNAAKQYLLNTKSTLNGFLGGATKGVVSAIKGGSSTNSQLVNLTTKSTVSLTGSLTSSTALTNPFFVISGQQNQTTANGLIPNYTSPLGVFNLTGRPKIHVNSVLRPGKPNNPNHPWDYRPNGDWYNSTMTIDQTVLNNIFITNPALAGNATVSIASQEILLDIVGDDFYYQSSPLIEDVGNRKFVRVNGTFDGIKWDPVTHPTGMVRLKVLVTSPTNAFPQVTIIKTFLANIVTP